MPRHKTSMLLQSKALWSGCVKDAAQVLPLCMLDIARNIVSQVRHACLCARMSQNRGILCEQRLFCKPDLDACDNGDLQSTAALQGKACPLQCYQHGCSCRPVGWQRLPWGTYSTGNYMHGESLTTQDHSTVSVGDMLGTTVVHQFRCVSRDVTRSRCCTCTCSCCSFKQSFKVSSSQRSASAGSVRSHQAQQACCYRGLDPAILRSACRAAQQARSSVTGMHQTNAMQRSVSLTRPSLERRACECTHQSTYAAGFVEGGQLCSVFISFATQRILSFHVSQPAYSGQTQEATHYSQQG